MLVNRCYYFHFLWVVHWQAVTLAHCVSKPQEHSVSSFVLAVHQRMCFCSRSLSFNILHPWKDCYCWLKKEKKRCSCLAIKELMLLEKWHVFRQWSLSPSLRSRGSKLLNPWCRKPAGCLERLWRCHLDLCVFTERNSRYSDHSSCASYCSYFYTRYFFIYLSFLIHFLLCLDSFSKPFFHSIVNVIYACLFFSLRA